MRRDEQGAAAVEWVLLVPVIVLLLGVVAMGVRLAAARQQVAQAASAGARAASLERGAPAAESAARSVADRGLSACASRAVSVDATGFRLPPGEPATVNVQVTCDVALGDLGLPVAGTISVTASASSALDRYRGRR